MKNGLFLFNRKRLVEDSKIGSSWMILDRVRSLRKGAIKFREQAKCIQPVNKNAVHQETQYESI